MIRLDITASVGADNITSFSLVDTDGGPIDLDALGVTKVTVKVCNRLGPAFVIDSDSDDVSFSGNTLLVKFGKLNVTGMHFPTVSYVSPSAPVAEVIAAQGFETEIRLKGVCG